MFDSAPRLRRLAILFLGVFITAFGKPDTGIYEEGLSARDNGQIMKALDIWYSVVKSSGPDDYDPRIGFAYIELVTQREMKQNYRKANEMYFWALNGLKMSEFKEVYEAELNRISPLITPKQRKAFQKDLNNEDPAFFDDIIQVWNQLDPTPITPYNERLMEHWERIGEIKRRYAGTNYGLEEMLDKDSRAETYIKYGEPDRLRKGVLSYNVASVKRWIRERMSDNPTPFQPNSSENRFQNQLENQLEDQIRSYHSNQEYEVWIYQNPSYYSDKVVYIFGSDNAGRSFKMKRSVEDFIPHAAFSMGQRNKIAVDLTVNESSVAAIDGEGDGLVSGTSVNPNDTQVNFGENITPAVIMQLMYYEQLLAIDELFANSYDNIVASYADFTNPLSISLASSARNRNIGAVARLQSSMPEQKSEIINKVSEIDIEAFPYRFLDKENKPYTIFFVQSDAYKAFSTDYFNNKYYNEEQEKLKNYVYQHELRVFDEKWNPKTSLTYKPLLDVNFNIQKADAGSVFILPFTSVDDQVVLAATLYNQDPDAISPVKNTPFDDELRGLGKTITNSPYPLENDVFMMSDIVLGYQKLENDKLQFPFIINNKNEIPIGENLVFYFEVYNINMQSSGTGKFTLELNMIPKRRGLYRLFNRNNGSVGLTLNFESAEALFSEVIEMQTANLEAGNYTLRIKATESSTNEVVEREIDIMVSDSPDEGEN
ncbi:GWxTD domain-containing protein [Balneola sp. MJW-20]|uniref:GWxTD domain-containing protein n=1 Tax=Gracilimonas aurantiaca TaxID=3234185 RepID=UPI003466C993